MFQRKSGIIDFRDNQITISDCIGLKLSEARIR